MIRLSQEQAMAFLEAQRQAICASDDNVSRDDSYVESGQDMEVNSGIPVVQDQAPPSAQNDNFEPTPQTNQDNRSNGSSSSSDQRNSDNAPVANNIIAQAAWVPAGRRKRSNHLDLTYLSLDAKHRTYRHIPVELRPIWTDFLDELLQELAAIRFASHERVPALLREFLDIPATYLKFSSQRRRRALQARISEAHEQLKQARNGSEPEEKVPEEKSSEEKKESDSSSQQDPEFGAPPKLSRAKLSEEAARKSKALAIINSVKAGECGRACDKLVRQPLAPLNEKTVEALKLLHPSCKDPINADGDEFDSNSFTYFDSAEVYLAIHESSKGSAPGRSGWCSELLLASWDSFCFRTVVTNLINWMANGSLSDGALRNKLLACRLFALSKEPASDRSTLPKVRPIAVSEIFVKLLSNLFLKKLKIDKLMPEFQYGVKCKGGIEKVLHGINHILAADPNSVALSIDFKNAFNSLSRKQILKQIQSNQDTKCLVNYFLWAHENPTPLLLENQDGSVYATLKSSEGTRQGDALSTFLFAWGWYPVLVSTNDVLQEENDDFPQAPAITTAIIDDTTLTGRIDRVSKAFDHLLKETSKLNLSIQKTKCKILVSQPDKMQPQELEKIQAFAAQHKIPIVNGNTETLGALIGVTEEKDVGVTKKQEQISEQLQEIQRLAPHAASIPGGIQALLLVVRMCLNQTMNYFVRTTPTQVALNPCKKLDKKVEQTICALLDLDPSLFGDHAQFKLRLPIKEGGAGLTSIASTAAAAFIASSCNAAETIHKANKWRASEARRTKQDMPSLAMTQLNQAFQEYKGKIKENPKSSDPLPESAERLMEELSKVNSKCKPPKQKQLYLQIAPKEKPFYEAILRQERLARRSAPAGNSANRSAENRSGAPSTDVNLISGGGDGACPDRQDPAAASEVPFSEALVLKTTTMSSKQKWALAPLTTLPTHPSLVLTTLEVRTFYKLLLGVSPLNQPSAPILANCVCKAPRLSATQRALHSHFCRSSSCRTLQVKRHNSIKEDVARLCKMVGIPVDVERVLTLAEQQEQGDEEDNDLLDLVAPQHPSRKKKNHVPDLTIHFPSLSGPVFADVVVTCPIAPSQVEKSTSSANAALNKASQAKVKKYQALAAQLKATSFPLAFETHGAVGPLVSNLAELFANHVVEADLCSLFQHDKPLDFFMRAFTCALCRGNAKVVQGTLNAASRQAAGDGSAV